MPDPRMTAAELDAIREAGINRDKVSGGTLKGAPRYTGPWKCPACQQENLTQPLEAGCEHCGSGAPGKHVGVDPRVERAALVEQARPSQVEGYAETLVVTRERLIQSAFDRFIASYSTHGLVIEPFVYDLARAAFTAGIEFALAQTMQPPSIGGGLPDGAIPLEGTKETRTIIAALDVFIENVLSQTPEEVRTGEWCTAAEARALIQQLERRS